MIKSTKSSVKKKQNKKVELSATENNPFQATTHEFFCYDPNTTYFPTKKSAIEFLRKAGIVTSKGKISSIYKNAK